MSSFSLYLGNINVSSSTSGLELDLSTSIDLSSSIAMGYSHIQVRPVDILVSREAWVTRGLGLCISFQLLVDGKRPQDESWHANTVEALGKVLKEAEVLTLRVHCLQNMTER